MSLKAYYYYAELDKVTDKMKKLYIDTRVSQHWQQIAMNIYLSARILNEHKVVYVWRF